MVLCMLIPFKPVLHAGNIILRKQFMEKSANEVIS